MGLILKKLTGTLLRRWVTGGVIGLILAGGAWTWHSFKENLIHEGQVACIQEINKQTVIDLRNALADERLVAADLRARAAADADANEEARDRLWESQATVSNLNRQIREQRKTDETYKSWSDTSLPNGVADRLRNAGSGSDTDTD